MDPELRKRLIAGLHQTYNNIGYDCWGDKIPGQGVFVEIVCDQLRLQCGPHGDRSLSTEDCDAFFELSAAERKRMCLEVGP